jgi:excisionase family DNA binding protein
MYLRCMDSLPDRRDAIRGLVPLIGVEELSALLGVPVATIYDWRTRGLGPVAHRFGKHLRFAICDVEAWIATRREDRSGAVAGLDGMGGPR